MKRTNFVVLLVPFVPLCPSPFSHLKQRINLDLYLENSIVLKMELLPI
jgi:hypothetical protein